MNPLPPPSIIDHTEAQIDKSTLMGFVTLSYRLPLILYTNSSLHYLVPLVHELLHGDVTVGVDVAGLDAVALGDLLHLVLDPHDGLPLCVRLRQGGLELLVGCDEALERQREEEGLTKTPP